MSDLSSQNIMYLPGVGPKKADILKKELKIVSFEDLLYYFPYKYVDRSQVYKISELNGNMPYIQIKGKIIQLQTIGTGRQQRLTAKVTDNTGYLDLIWFKGHKYIKEQINPDREYLIFGKPSLYNGQINIIHPEMDMIKSDIPPIHLGLKPFYNTTEKMKSGFINSKAIQKYQKAIFDTYIGKITESLPSYIINSQKLLLLHDSLKNIHFPENDQLLQAAQYRLKFEELFYIQLNILKLRNQRSVTIKGHQFPIVGEFTNNFYNNNLPFDLTHAQKRVIKEIRRDLGSGKQMNRLLQGDVGSGKTLVAFMVMLIASDNYYQSCLMAPTEILAIQHYKSIIKMAEGLNLKVALLTGSTKKKERDYIHSALLSGEINILIGTHALIEDIVQFKNLGLVVIDEQHRFGVEQRAKLWKKNSTPPHVLVMTATPIPRTLAMTIYGDLDVSIIDELPPGRKPIQTVHYYHNRRNNLNRFIRDELNKGRQIYVVYPLIEESEKSDFKNLMEGYEYMQRVFPDFKICMVHGKLKPSEKEEAMKLFAAKEAQIMVATTVIEVGVNVPNASVMIIESAERFGLSQLHQLRGRVGRGAEQSYCILMTSHKLAEDTRKRIDIMVQTNDGFEISEADLKFRGPGDMEGTQQSGLPFDLKISNLAKDQKILQYARNVAENILATDPLLELTDNQLLNRQLSKLSKKKLDWSMIS
ncbi:MAG: ATP-dependent DNA helicase RecG [Marinilabiliaceae bacterium]|nr:ATP-dependent DNA helicase RecG [Marinilabiliaceae bacterium]